MTKFTENLWRDLAHEHGQTIAHTSRPAPGRARRPRVLAGSTLALAAAGVGVTLGLTATGSTPAFAVTTNSDGTVQVTISQTSDLPQANAKLTAMGIHEQVTIYMASGAAAVSGPVTCAPAQGVSGPPVQVLVGTNGTEVISSGNTGAGTWHLASCHVTGDTGSGNTGSGDTGNTGAG
jgi:hypothetical protein